MKTFQWLKLVTLSTHIFTSGDIHVVWIDTTKILGSYTQLHALTISITIHKTNRLCSPNEQKEDLLNIIYINKKPQPKTPMPQEEKILEVLKEFFERSCKKYLLAESHFLPPFGLSWKVELGSLRGPKLFWLLPSPLLLPLPPNFLSEHSAIVLALPSWCWAPPPPLHATWLNRLMCDLKLPLYQ